MSHDELAKRRAILFTDLRGSTEASQGLPIEGFLELMRRHADVLLGSSYRYSGVRAQSSGDGFFLLFHTVAEALQAAAQAQATCDDDIAIRMAIHWVPSGLTPTAYHSIEETPVQKQLTAGQFEFKEYGEVALVARVCSIAKPRQILLTADAFAESGISADVQWMEWPNRALKSFRRNFTLYEFLWSGNSFGEPGTRYVPNWYPGAINSYVERRGIEHKIREHLAVRRDPGKTAPVAPIIAIVGSGGMGKTRLAISTAVHTSPMFEDHVRFFDFSFAVLQREQVLGLVQGRVEAVGDDTVLFNGFLRVLRDGLNIEPGRHRDGGTDILEDLESLDTMLILDNLETVVCPAVQDFISLLIRMCRRLTLICTTRQDLGLTEGVYSVDLDQGLSLDEAAELFTKRWLESAPSDVEQITVDENLVRQIVDSVERIPLAIELIAAAAKDREPLESVLASLESNRQAALSTPDRRRRNDDGLTGRRHASMQNSLWWSYRHIEEKAGADLARAFRVLGTFQGPFRGEDFLAVANTTDRSLLFDLQSYSIVRRSSGPEDVWTVHRESREFAKRRLIDLNELSEIERRFVSHYLAFVSSTGYEVGIEPGAFYRMKALEANWLRAATVQSQLVSGGDHSAIEGLREFATKVEPYLYLMQTDVGGFLAVALTSFRTIGDRREEAICQRMLGDIALYHHKLDLAAEHYSAALNALHDLGDLNEAVCVMRLGDVALRRGDRPEAVVRYNEAVSLFQRAGDTESESSTINVASCYCGLADAYTEASEFDTAASYFEKALPMFRHLRSASHESICLSGLARISEHQYKFEEAYGYAQQSLDIAVAFQDIQQQSICLGLLGKIASHRYDRRSAESHFKQALTLNRDRKNSHSEATSLVDLGSLALNEHRTEESEEHFRAALAIHESLHDRRGMAVCFKGLGDGAMQSGDVTPAFEFFSQAAELYEQVDNLHGLASCKLRLGDAIKELEHDIPKASLQYLEARDIFAQIGDKIGVAHCFERLGDSRKGHWISREGYGPALRLFREVGDTLGEANCLRGLGLAAFEEGEVAEALDNYDAAYAIYKSREDIWSMAETQKHYIMATTGERRENHRSEARRLWLSLGRLDLVERNLDNPESPFF